jgi:hypothetical protein
LYISNFPKLGNIPVNFLFWILMWYLLRPEILICIICIHLHLLIVLSILVNVLLHCKIMYFALGAWGVLIVHWTMASMHRKFTCQFYLVLIHLNLNINSCILPNSTILDHIAIKRKIRKLGFYSFLYFWSLNSSSFRCVKYHACT